MDVLAAGVEMAAGLRDGLAAPSATGAARRLRGLLGADAVGLVDLDGARTWAGDPPERIEPLVADVLRTDRRATRADVQALPLRVRDEPAGVLVVAGPVPGAAARQAAEWIADALHRGRLETSADAAEQAELRALRAEISPHFVYNALTTIASFVRSDPARARELILDFALFIRHNLARHGEYTTLAGEFRAVEAYLALARAVLGERLRVQVRIAPEVLPVTIPFLVLQPLVENAVQHGVERAEAGGSVQVSGEAQGEDCVIAVEDDGPGMAPERAREALAGRGTGSLGLVNVDRRLCAVFGAGYGLVIETAAGAGTRVAVRVPRFHPGVMAG
jgi:two-component system LytT family sensor kinase